MALLGAVNAQQKWLGESADTRKLTDQQQQALSVLTSGKVAQAFDIDKEPAAIRDKYGRHAFGQSILLARRLVEAGVPVVQANMGRVQNWDTHGDLFKRMKKDLLPPVDAGVSALLDDLADRGMLDDTLVMMVGEFGREPKINKTAGRDHWAPCFCGLFAGAGVRAGTGDRQERQERRVPLHDAVLARRHRRDGLHRPRASTRTPRSATASTARCNSIAGGSSSRCSTAGRVRQRPPPARRER